MAKENSFIAQEIESKGTETSLTSETMNAKKKFIEPELSTPVDVLEATTFFQATTSGVTN